MTSNLIGIGAALGIAAIIWLTVRKRRHHEPKLDAELRDGWIIEHRDRGAIIACTRCAYFIDAADLSANPMQHADFIDLLIEQAGLEHTHQETR